MAYVIINGDARETLREMEEESVQCCVTSPPYWGLRDFKLEPLVWGGTEGCEHEWGLHQTGRVTGGGDRPPDNKWKNVAPDGQYDSQSVRSFCLLCGAWRGSLGLEPTPELYTQHLVEIFREVRRVLRKDGSLWLNLGDSFTRDGRKGQHKPGDSGKQAYIYDVGGGRASACGVGAGLKPKDLIGVPWRVAFALQADGWTLRSEIVWAKPNPMPESVRDRPTKSHEQIFLFARARWSGPEPGRFAAIKDEDARWLALFLDTEGNICAKRAVSSNGGENFGAQICFASTSESLLSTARRIIGAGAVLQRGGTNAPMYYLQLSNNQATGLLHRLYPFLIVKQRQARLAIHLQRVIADSGRERRTKIGQLRGRARADEYTLELERVWARMKLLNHSGDPDLADVPEPEYGGWRDCERYYYDADAIKEPFATDPKENYPARARITGRGTQGAAEARGNDRDKSGGFPPRILENRKDLHGPTYSRHRSSIRGGQSLQANPGGGRNKRSVWTIATAPCKEAHFATFPPALVEPMILAGCPPDGIVLDPFCGAGTTLLVAGRLGRNSIGVELSPAYCEIAEKRLKGRK